MYFHFQICLEQDLPDSKPSSCPPPQLHRFHPPVFSLLAARLAHHCFPQRGLVCFNQRNLLKKQRAQVNIATNAALSSIPLPSPSACPGVKMGTGGETRGWFPGGACGRRLRHAPPEGAAGLVHLEVDGKGAAGEIGWDGHWSDWLDEKFWRDCQVQGWDSIDIDIRILKSIDINKILYLAYWTPLLPGSRVGLARARLLGVEKAAAPILLFLDSHCEVVSRPLDNLLTVRSTRWEENNAP